MKNQMIDRMNAERIQRGQKVRWLEHPQVVTTVQDVRHSEFQPETVLLNCTNGCRFTLNEVEIIEEENDTGDFTEGGGSCETR